LPESLLDDFARLASHDLREPLRAIRTFSQLLEQDLGGELPPDARRDLEFILAGVDRIERLVNALAALSRAGRVEMHLESVNLRRLVDAALSALRERIGDAVIDVDELPDVTADPELLSQVFEHLIANALAAGGKHLRVYAEPGVVVCVRDDGAGIRPENLEKIFQPFRRFALDPNNESTGMGLALCRRIIERHGGRIWAESERPGAGATFRFTLNEETSP